MGRQRGFEPEPLHTAASRESSDTLSRGEKWPNLSFSASTIKVLLWRNEASLLARRRYLWQRGSGKLVTLAGCGGRLKLRWLLSADQPEVGKPNHSSSRVLGRIFQHFLLFVFNQNLRLRKHICVHLVLYIAENLCPLKCMFGGYYLYFLCAK